MDKVIIESKISSLLNLLEKLKNILKEYETNKTLKEIIFYAAEKKAEEMVELAISINQELLKEKGKISLSYYDSFIDLKVFNSFSEQELKELASTAGFRNRLAYEYLEVNEDIAIKSMKNVLRIYPPYLQKVKKLL
ncbi:MAG: HepT-like ribonuclease domain-containing protein [Nanoarchaeota archaeon]